MLECIRTPDERFARIPNYPFTPNYVNIDGIRLHYVDEGEKAARTVLMMHGEPTWSYLYRHMIPICAAAGHRVIAPDLIGFGKSDKPIHQSDYSYQRHVDWMSDFIKTLDLQNITLVCQDWGSLIGLRLAAENESRFDAIVLGNGGLPTGDKPPPKAFLYWQRFAKYSPWFPISRIVDTATFKKLSKPERHAYDAPFPNSTYKAGTRAFPQLVPTSPDDPASEANRAAWSAFENWRKPFITAFSNGDPVTRGGEKVFQQKVPGCQGQPHKNLVGGHFLQEDASAEFATLVNTVMRKLQ